MTNRYNMRLLAEILGEQDESRATGTLSEERAYAALTVGPKLTAEERRLIWHSPDARNLFLSVYQRVRLDVMERTRAAGYGGTERRIAASGGDFEEISGKGYVVSIFRDDIPGAEWSVSVVVEADYLAIVGPETTVVLRDSGGHVWAMGVPNAQRSISQVWTLQDDPPHARLSRYGLELAP